MSPQSKNPRKNSETPKQNKKFFMESINEVKLKPPPATSLSPLPANTLCFTMNILENNNATRIAAFWRGYSVRKVIQYTNYQSADWSEYDAMTRVLEEEMVRRPDLRRHTELFRALLDKARIRLDNEAPIDCMCDFCIDDRDNAYDNDDDDNGDWWTNDGGGYCDY